MLATANYLLPRLRKHLPCSTLTYLNRYSHCTEKYGTSFKPHTIHTQANPNSPLSKHISLNPGQEDTSTDILSTTNKLLDEKSVGITEFISESTTGFSGILKHRYSDFMVNEIDLCGNVVHLTDFSLPNFSLLDPSKEEQSLFSYEDSVSKLSNLLTDSKLTKDIQNLFHSKGINPEVVLIEAIDNKEKRTEIHQFFKNSFDRKLSTDTLDGCIKIQYVAEGVDNRDRNFRRKRESWNVAEGEYCRFVLYKENKDTIEAVNLLAKLMKLNSKIFSYAGTKDKRGVTTQLVTGYRVKAERLAGLNKHLRGMKIGNFEYCKSKVDLGDLKGNRFDVILRDVSTDSKDVVDKAISTIRDKGFINYYGMQRFGSHGAPTHMIGKALLLGEWEQAVNLILMPREGEKGSVAEARQEWAKSHDPKKAAKLFPRRCVAETHILSAFANSGQHRDFLGAINTIPRNLRMMYVHAYQSYVWNHMVSQRICHYGSDRAVVGDIVLVDDSELNKAEEENPHHEMTDEIYPKASVKILTPMDVSLHTIYDVVLPLPGFDVVYPEHEIGNKYHELMREDGIDSKDMRRNVKEFSLPGAYRKCIAKPENVSWQMVRYSDPMAPLSRSDFDVLTTIPEPKNETTGFHQAIRLSLSLNSSQYATMALREILKCETTNRFHYMLSQQVGKVEV